MGKAERRPERDTSTEQELRTIAFRMREIQRLMSMRVEQENRRLEADGLEPVSRPPFVGEGVAERDDD